MIDHYQMKELLTLLAFCGVAGVPWLIAHGVSRLATSHRHLVRFIVMTGFACLWILVLWPMTGRWHREALPVVIGIMPWWTAIVIGIVIERRRGNAAEQPAAV